MNDLRIGKFTSSEVYRLMGDGRKEGEPSVSFYTYVEEKKFEIKLGVALDVETYSKAMAWGTFLERRVARLYPDKKAQYVSDQTIQHPELEYLAGTPDVVGEDYVGDIKCYYPKKFAQYYECLVQGDYELFKSEFPQEFWQLVSNATLAKKEWMKAIIYLPYKSELEEIRKEVENYEDNDLWKYRFIYESADEQLPHMSDFSVYTNFNMFQFRVREEDKEKLEERVKLATNYLLN